MIAKKLTNSLQLAILIFLCACNNSADQTSTNNPTDTLTEAQKHMSENALRGTSCICGLEVETMATEPMLKNPPI